MKTKMKSIVTVIAALALTSNLIFTSCAVKGCKDKDSTNYNSKATDDDGTCNYQGQYVYWWKKGFTDSCVAHGVANVKIYVDGALAGTVPITTPYYTTAPSCGGGALTVTKDLGTSKTKILTSNATLVNASNATLYTIPISNNTFAGNTCTSQEYLW